MKEAAALLNRCTGEVIRKKVNPLVIRKLRLLSNSLVLWNKKLTVSFICLICRERR